MRKLIKINLFVTFILAVVFTGILNVKASGNGGICTAPGYVRDNSDCSVFYHCIQISSGFISYRYQCPNGLSFNPLIAACDYPALVACTNGSGGGGSCGWGRYTPTYDPNGGLMSNLKESVCNISQAAAISLYELNGGNWCCDSCGSTWYCGS